MFAILYTTSLHETVNTETKRWMGWHLLASYRGGFSGEHWLLVHPETRFGSGVFQAYSWVDDNLRQPATYTVNSVGNGMIYYGRLVELYLVLV